MHSVLLLCILYTHEEYDLLLGIVPTTTHTLPPNVGETVSGDGDGDPERNKPSSVQICTDTKKKKEKKSDTLKIIFSTVPTTFVCLIFQSFFAWNAYINLYLCARPRHRIIKRILRWKILFNRYSGQQQKAKKKKETKIQTIYKIRNISIIYRL